MFDIFEGLERLGFKNLKVDDIYVKEVEEKKEGGSATTAVKQVSVEECLYDKSYTCPCCDRLFTERAVKKGKTRQVSSDSDLRGYYEPVDPMYYDVVLCPKCGYTAISQNFNLLRDAQVKLIKDNITANFRPTHYPNVFDNEIATERYKFALLNAFFKKSKNSEKAYICLKLAWLTREKGDQPEVEKAYLTNVVEGFKEAFSKEKFPICGLDEVTLMYILADIERRLGNYAEAQKWVGTIIVSAAAPQRVKDKAIELKDTIRKEINAKKREMEELAAQSEPQTTTEQEVKPLEKALLQAPPKKVGLFGRKK